MTSDAERVVRQLLLRDAGLSGLEMSGAGLEEAFLTLTSTQATRRRISDERTMVGAGGAR